MKKEDSLYQAYLQILREELVPAMGCTEPIAISYCAAKARRVLGGMPDKVLVEASGNIIKNVKSVIVPNTGNLRGIEAAAAAGIVAGNPDLVLEVISQVTEEQKLQMRSFLETTEVIVRPADSGELLDIMVTLWAGTHSVKVRIARRHTNIILIEEDGVATYEGGGSETQANREGADRGLLNVEAIYDFALSVDLKDIAPVLDRQIAYNTAISREGMEKPYGASVGRVLLHAYGDGIVNRAKAAAAAGSDARMSGCELPVVINSGSGNQGLTASLPVITYAQELSSSRETLYRALIISNLTTIHQKTGIGSLSAYCGAVCAGCGAGAGIAYLLGGDFKAIAHTLVNALAILSGMICDGAKPSCAAKIAMAVDAGILGYQLYLQGQEFKGGDGIVSKGVENTIYNVGRLGRDGMQETDREILRIMTNC